MLCKKMEVTIQKKKIGVENWVIRAYKKDCIGLNGGPILLMEENWLIYEINSFLAQLNEMVLQVGGEDQGALIL